jgi:hypothetical protein
LVFGRDMVLPTKFTADWGAIEQNLTRFTRLCVTSHSQPLINAKYKFQVKNYL